MKSNISQADKLIRISLGLVLGFTGLFIDQIWMSIIALIILTTALINFCPIYAIMGYSTRKFHASPFQTKHKKKNHH